jgi:AraC family cel operon transcriptional repressor
MEPKLLTANRFVDQNMGVCYRYVYSDTEYFRPHYHDYNEIFLMLDGVSTHHINGSVVRLQERNLVFVRPQDVHDYVGIGGNKFSMLNITFSSETADAIFGFLGDGFLASQFLKTKFPPTVELSNNDFAKLEGTMSSIRAIDPKNYNLIKSKLRLFVLDILTKYFFVNENEVETVPYWLEAMCERVSRDGNFKNNTEFFFSLSDKTREHVSRSMKKYYNQTVTEYINGLRINYIANMLLNSNHKICDIIYDSGFNNISWASEFFKQKYGCTMLEYRKQKSNAI